MKIGKKILMQEIDRAQVDKLLTHKKTDLLRGFISSAPAASFRLSRHGGRRQDHV